MKKRAEYLYFIKFQKNYKFLMEYMVNMISLHLNRPMRFALDLELMEEIQEIYEQEKYALAA